MDESGAREVEIQSVTPVRLQSNHEVVQKTQNIGVILATVSEDWEQRLNGSYCDLIVVMMTTVRRI